MSIRPPVTRAGGFDRGASGKRPGLVKQAQEDLDDKVKAVAEFFGNTIHKWAQILHHDGKHHYVNFEVMMKEVAAPRRPFSTT